eukprot:scaffold67491_cov42-Prasinocladus_malaysianus.AAC.3
MKSTSETEGTEAGVERAGRAGACEMAIGGLLQECIAGEETRPRVRDFLKRLVKARATNLLEASFSRFHVGDVFSRTVICNQTSPVFH